MSARSNFLAGCGAGVATTLAAAALLLSPARRCSCRSREEHSNLPESPLCETGSLADSVDPKDESEVAEQPNLKPVPGLPTVEPPAQTDNNMMSSGSRAAPDIESVLKPPWYRRLKAADCITGAVVVILTAALTWVGVAFQNQAKNMTAQLTESETSMRELRAEVHADQRAWIGLTEATVQPLTLEGGGFTIKLQNTGKTPALDVQVSDVITVEEIGEAAGIREPGPSAGNSAGTLMPGAGYTTDVWFKTSSDVASSLTHDQLRAVNFVRVTYKDIFQVPHVTKVCFYWHSSLPRVKPCDSYNEVN
jgi:hypothetical protein